MKLSIDLPHPTHHVLIIDHDREQAALLHTQIVTALTDIAIDCVTFASVEELPISLQSQSDVIICDESCLTLADNDCLRQIQLRQPGAAVIVTAHAGTVQDAVDIMRRGARGFVDKTDTPRLIRLIREELAHLLPTSSPTGSIVSGEAVLTSVLADLLDSMVDAAVCFNLRERKIIYASAAFEEVFGYPLSHLLEEHDLYQQVLHPDDVERVTAALSDCLNGRTAELEHRIIWPDGRIRWLQRKAWINFDSDGQPLHLNDSARDITARKQMEQAMAAVEAKERALLAAMPDMIFHLDASNVILDVRGTIPEQDVPMLDLIGMKIQDLLGKPLFPQEIIHEIIGTLTAVRGTRTTITVEYCTANQHYYEARFAPIGETDEVIALVRNITERKQAEHDLYTSREQYRSLLESSDAAILMINAEDRYVYVNAIAAQPFGVTAETLIGKSVYDLFPNDAENIVRDVHTVFASNIGMSLEPKITIGGQDHWYRTRLEPIRAADGQPYAVLIHSSDITNRKAMELELRASEARYRSIVEDQTELICRYDPQMRITFANEAYCKSFGLTSEDIIGKSFFERIPAEEHEAARAYVRSLTRENPTAVSVHHSLHTDGTIRWVEWKDRAIFDEHGTLTEYQGVGRDITEQALAQQALVASEQKLRQSEAYLRTLVDSQATFNLRTNLQGIITYCNDRYAQQFAWIAPSLVGQSSMTTIIPEDREKVVMAVQTCVTNIGKPVQVELRKPTQNGGVIWTLWEFSTVQASSGAVQEIQCVGFDITKQKRAEAALQGSYELLEQRVVERTAQLQSTTNQLEAIFQHSADAILLVDVAHGIQQANRAFSELIGQETTACLGRNLAQFVQPTAVERIEQAMQATIEAKKPHQIETRLVHADGTMRDVEMSLAPVNPMSDKVTSLVCIIWDMTAHKRAEAELLVQAQRLQLAAEAGGMGVWEWDIENDRVTGDEQMRTLYGVPPWVETLSISDVWANASIHPDDLPRLQEEATYYLEQGTILDTHFRITPPDSETRHLRLRAVMLRDSDGNPLRSIGINWDVSDEKAAAEALERALQRERELGELKSRFVSMASHEFRTPLAAILATTDSLSLYRSKMDEAKIDDRLDRIRQQVMQLTDLIEDMLQLARIQAGRVKFDPVPGDVGKLCSEIIEEFDAQSDYQGRIIFEPDPTRVLASFDARLLRQVISNLLHNALKYSKSEQLVLLKLKQSECHFSFTIKDEGIGVPPDDLKRLFEPFHRASNVGDISGTGLGLSITLQAVELHGGAITVDSEVGTGTIFTVVLPKTQTQNDPNCAPTAETNEA